MSNIYHSFALAMLFACVSCYNNRTIVTLSSVSVSNITSNSADYKCDIDIKPGKEGIPKDLEIFLLCAEGYQVPSDSSGWQRFKIEKPDTVTHYEVKGRLSGFKPRSTYQIAVCCRWDKEHLITGATRLTTTQALVPVDLGLPSGISWASENITDNYGKTAYFAWGETSTKSNYNWDTYMFGTYDNLTKYTTRSSDSRNGNFDGYTVLELEDDAAQVKFGEHWRIPSMNDWKELVTRCKWTWTTLNSNNGFKVTGPNGKSIFLPADGQKDRSERYQTGQKGFYWSSDLYKKSSELAWGFVFDSEGADYDVSDSWLFGYSWEWSFTNTGRRCLGRAIRAVYDDQVDL